MGKINVQRKLMSLCEDELALLSVATTVTRSALQFQAPTLSDCMAVTVFFSLDSCGP